MQNIIWQENDLFAEEETRCNGALGGTMESEERNQHEAIQISKFLNPLKSEHRQSYVALLERFGTLLANGRIQDIAKGLLTDDFELFLFSSTGRMATQNARRPQGFIDLYKNILVKERYVRETHIDVEKDTACQICNYRIMYADSDTPVDEVACEIFTLRDGRISKYRVCFASLKENVPEDLLTPTPKDIMLAKAKRINFAMAGRPNYAEFASLLHDSVEYKIWRWNDYKCFTFKKNDLPSAATTLEQYMTVKRVVPYDTSAEVIGRTVLANFNHHLIDKITGKRFEWLSTCIFAFNKDLEIVKISHQGELFPTGETDIRFEVHTREKLENKVRGFYSSIGSTTDALYNDSVLYDCNFLTFSFAELPLPGHYQGFKQVDKLTDARKRLSGMKQDFIYPVDVFLDVSSEGYDVVFAVVYSQGSILSNEGGEKINAFALVRKSFENGRLAKSLEFLAPVKYPIESPFDDKTYQALNIK